MILMIDFVNRHFSIVLDGWNQREMTPTQILIQIVLVIFVLVVVDYPNQLESTGNE